MMANSEDLSTADELARVEAIVGEATAAKLVVKSAPKEELRLTDPSSVDVDLCLSLNEADAAQIAAEADAVFAVIDENGDGVITREELGRHMAGQFYTPDAMGRLFDSLDSNADGVISRQELREGFARHESASLRLALGLASTASCHIGDVAQPVSERRDALSDELFDVIDTNGDGKIDSREMQAHLLSTGYSTRTVDGIRRAHAAGGFSARHHAHHDPESVEGQEWREKICAALKKR